MLVDAVIAYKNGDHEPGNAYIRFTREHRGKEQAKKVAETIVRNAAASSWADCHLWPAWGYKTKDPTPVAEKYQKGRKRK